MLKKITVFKVVFGIVLLGGLICSILQKDLIIIIMLIFLTAAAVFLDVNQEKRIKNIFKEKLKLEEKLNIIGEENEANTETAIKYAEEKIVDFHSKISHGLRIPISVVYGYSKLISEDTIIDEGVKKEYLNTICDQIIYINNLFSQIVSEVNMSSGLPEMTFRQIDMLKLVMQISNDMSLSARNLGIEINVKSTEDDIIIFGDPVQLTKAFYNIIENSLKYMGKSGDIEITVSKPKKEQVCISFKDDGNGLSKEETEQIFNDGYTGTNSSGGKGNGLSIVEKVVLKHGGEAFARSSLGGGMSIFVFLPVRPTKNVIA